MALRDSKIRVLAKGNDIKRRLLDRNASRCFLLKRAGETQRYTIIVELTKGWYTEYNEYRGQQVWTHATLDEAFTDQMAQMSRLAIGVPNGDQMPLYMVDPARRDVIPPTVSSPFWRAYLTYDPKERFTIS